MISSVNDLETREDYQLNPSILDLGGKYLCAFRQTVNRGYYYGRIRVCWVSYRFELLCEPYELEFEGLPEDPRLVRVGDRIFITYVRYLCDKLFHHFIAELELHNPRVIIRPNSEVELSMFSRPRHEKNWVPFVADKGLNFIYSISPHIVISWNIDKRVVETIERTDPDLSNWSTRWGSPRGGTPAIRCFEGFLTFFHSSIFTSGAPWIADSPRDYFVGAYVFEATAPFRITRMLNSKLECDEFFKLPNCVSPHRVVFPTGLTIGDSDAVVSYGDMDTRSRILTISLEKLDRNLHPLAREYTNGGDHPASKDTSL